MLESPITSTELVEGGRVHVALFVGRKLIGRTGKGVADGWGGGVVGVLGWLKMFGKSVEGWSLTEGCSSEDEGCGLLGSGVLG